ncbi:MAG: dolichyl-diphosphooligosaccharide--protein glycosyltransferase subunit STT3 [Candidatus Omnitrophica bacterium]|nr:dolichyl-diphosphooligosaccharide--protein glycosyltransferase subunit STT3 [Candidatus Omnitrophota bacterium]
MQKLLIYVLFIFTVLLGMFIRYEDIRYWKTKEEMFFYKGEPIYSEYDSFYFARYALDIEEGLYIAGQADPLRCFPENYASSKGFHCNYIFYGALISHIFYYLHKITNLSVAWLTYYLIPILSITFAFPLFLYFNKLKLPFAGIIGALVTVCSSIYLSRSNLMRLDTDVLNLTFPFFIAYFFYSFFNSSNTKDKVLWIGLSSLFLIFYQLWYGHPNLNFVLIITFFIAYIWNNSRIGLYPLSIKFNFNKKDILYLAILILPQLWYIYQAPFHLLWQVLTLVFNIKSSTTTDKLFSDFPNVLVSISELSRYGFKGVLSSVIYSYILGILGLIGAVLLFVIHLRSLIFLFPFFVIGLLAFVSGIRFGMYLAPFIGFGLGFMIHFIFEKFFPRLNIFKEEHKQRLLVLIIGAFMVLEVILVQRMVIDMNYTPVLHARLVKNMEWIKENAPKNAVVWTWWDYGYAFQLYARRSVVHDGGSQTTPKTYFVARSFSTSDPREAWLITSFVSNYGLNGLAQIMKNGASAEEVVKRIKSGEFYKPIEVPVYWVFTEDLIGKFGWIYYFGSYEFKKKEGFRGRISFSICQASEPHILDCQISRVRLDDGTIHVENSSVPVKEIYYLDETKSKFQGKGLQSTGNILQILKNKDNMTLLFNITPALDKTLFNEMFILRKYDDRYFELVYDDFPSMVVYRVKSNPP